MTKWYVKDLSKLTGVSVQTLHHYDRIDLLKPSLRLDNDYRVYTEKDLLKLQQIIALKFFGFELSQIKAFLTSDKDAYEHFNVQATLLEKKATALLDTSQVLKSIIVSASNDKSIPWETIIQLIEVYHMTQQLDHAWVKEIFTPDELKQYATFESELKTRFSPEQKALFESNWKHLVDEISKNLQQDPTSKIGKELGAKCMSLINELYDKKNRHLRTKIFEQGFGEGKGLEDVGLTKAMVSWLEKAVDAYWHERIYHTLDKVGKISSASLLQQWHEVLNDMYGEDDNRKKQLYKTALADDRISQAAKDWLKSLTTH